MNYRSDKYGNQISILGYGCMRFPKTAGKINLKDTERQILTAIREGVNYFDTAYIYPGTMGFPLAVESAGSHLCVVRHEYG